MFHWCAYSITLTFSASLHYVSITLMTSRQNICTAVQYHIYGVAKSARVCDKLFLYWCNLPRNRPWNPARNWRRYRSSDFFSIFVISNKSEISRFVPFFVCKKTFVYLDICISLYLLFIISKWNCSPISNFNTIV
jgi:hypothetical protein